MPFYRHEENDLDSADGVGFSPEDVPRAAAVFGGYMVTKGMELAMHEHRKAQLVLTLRGVVRCEADQGVWIVPPRCAVWIPGNLPHSVSLAGNVEVYCLFVEPDAAPALPRRCCTLSISPLLERLLLHVAQMPVLYDVDGADGRIATVLLDQLSLAPVDPSDRATIDDWGRRMAIAQRTLTRALKRETGMSFGRWRRQLHILIALQRLAEGASVQTVALDLGYEGASAFVTMFRKALGKPPARYLADRRIAA
ncbi:helix-turn-helix transcriptional regulator [Bradyrhizobium sp. 31Argb]|uniref:AraC family transcriptional regulator n=1 Tax=Bradyrhizobium sp. 31Argb TaxID=3141247 RepID=UPI003748F12D